MSLETTKQRLSEQYLGKGGIHGIGLSRAKNAVRVHMASGATAAQMAQQSAVLEELKRDAAPFDVLVTVEDRPTTTE